MRGKQEIWYHPPLKFKVRLLVMVWLVVVGPTPTTIYFTAHNFTFANTTSPSRLCLDKDAM